MATNRSIQLMLHAVYIKLCIVYPCPAPLLSPPYGSNLNFTELYTLTRFCVFFRHRVCFQRASVKPMSVKGKSPPKGNLYTPRGKMYPKIEIPSASLIWQVWELLVLKPDMNLWRDSLELQPFLGAATMKITYVVRQSQESTHRAAAQLWEHL